MELPSGLLPRPQPTPLKASVPHYLTSAGVVTGPTDELPAPPWGTPRWITWCLRAGVPDRGRSPAWAFWLVVQPGANDLTSPFTHLENGNGDSCED